MNTPTVKLNRIPLNQPEEKKHNNMILESNRKNHDNRFHRFEFSHFIYFSKHFICVTRLSVQFLSFSCNFRQKCCQIIGWRQWRIQDFPQGGAPTPKSAIIFQFFAKNCMKMKEFGPPGGGARPWRPPLDPPMGVPASGVGKSWIRHW